jgi:hypothetical protein
MKSRGRTEPPNHAGLRHFFKRDVGFRAPLTVSRTEQADKHREADNARARTTNPRHMQALNHVRTDPDEVLDLATSNHLSTDTKSGR